MLTTHMTIDSLLKNIILLLSPIMYGIDEVRNNVVLHNRKSNL
nr:MAG TPA: hypothetical protein [Caudoviricetes sp.]